MGCISILDASIDCQQAVLTLDLDTYSSTIIITTTNLSTKLILDATVYSGPVPDYGVEVTIQYNSDGSEVSDGDTVEVTVNDGYDGDSTRAIISSCPVPPQPDPEKEEVPFLKMCDDGRININLCEPVAIYPTRDNGVVHMTVIIFRNGYTLGHFGFFVSAEELASLPPNPDAPIMVAQSRFGFATLWWLPSNEFQVNAGPDYEGKNFVFRFKHFPGQIPEIETFYGDGGEAEPAESGDVIQYVIQRGDNLFRIGLRFGIPYQQLAAFNNIADPAEIYAGQVILIPR